MQRVEIRVEGHLDTTWAEWLDGFTLVHTEQNETLLMGKVKDQAALYGLVAKLRDLGVKLVAIKAEVEAEVEAEVKAETEAEIRIEAYPQPQP